jgi:hypothetical protein
MTVFVKTYYTAKGTKYTKLLKQKNIILCVLCELRGFITIYWRLGGMGFEKFGRFLDCNNLIFYFSIKCMPDSFVGPAFYNFGRQAFQFNPDLFGFTAQKTG